MIVVMQANYQRSTGRHVLSFLSNMVNGASPHEVLAPVIGVLGESAPRGHAPALV